MYPTDISDLYGGESAEFRILKELGNQRTSSGSLNWTSPTSTIQYNSVSGQQGILNQLATVQAVSDALFTATRAARIGNFAQFISVTSAATLTSAQFGSFVELSGTTYTVNVPTPVSNSGMLFEFWNQAGTITLSTPAGQFKGLGFTAGSTYTIAAGCYIFICSDGTNWFLSDNQKLYSPTITGVPIAPTASAGTNNTQLATTAYVDGLANGWRLLSNTFTYATADSPTFTMTVAGIDLTGIIGVDSKIKLTQTTVEYFIVTAIVFSTNTTITLYGGTDYTLVSSPAISAVYYSNAKAPFGFPLDPNKWKVRVVDNTGYTLSGPGVGTYYNPGSLKVTLPIGSWTLSGQFQMYVSGSAGVIYTINGALSTSASSVSDTDLVDFGTLVDIGSVKFLRIKTLTVAAKTVYYLIMGVTYGTPASISIPLPSNTVLEAVCAYL